MKKCLPEVVQETQIYRRYLALFDRTVKFPASDAKPAQSLQYDIVGHPQCNFHFATTFPVHLGPSGEAAEVTLLREYAQGLNSMMYSLPGGGFNPNSHSSYLHCAQCELSEEAHLMGGDWANLLPDGHPGLSETKWCSNRFTPFICINPQVDEAPGPRDAEEILLEVERVPIAALTEIMLSGDMLLHSITTSYLALDYLRSQGLLAR